MTLIEVQSNHLHSYPYLRPNVKQQTRKSAKQYIKVSNQADMAAFGNLKGYRLRRDGSAICPCEPLNASLNSTNTKEETYESNGT